jgi:hypothetical protein
LVIRYDPNLDVKMHVWSSLLVIAVEGDMESTCMW